MDTSNYCDEDEIFYFSPIIGGFLLRQFGVLETVKVREGPGVFVLIRTLRLV